MQAEGRDGVCSGEAPDGRALSPQLPVVPLQGGQPLVAAEGHQQRGADVLVAEVGEPGVAQLAQGLAARVTRTGTCSTPTSGSATTAHQRLTAHESLPERPDHVLQRKDHRQLKEITASAAKFRT